MMQKVLSVPPDGYAAGLLRPEIVFSERFRVLKESGGLCDMVFFVAFVGCGIAHVVLSIVLIASTNVDGQLQPVGPLYDEITSCLPSGRRLQTERTMFSFLGSNPEVISVLLLLFPLVSGLWLLVLQKFSFAATWGTIILSSALYIVIGVSFLVYNDSSVVTTDPTVGILFIVWGVVVLLAFTMFWRTVSKTATRIKIAAVILSKKPSIFIAAAVIELIMLGFIAFTMVAFINSGYIFEADLVECTLRKPSYVSNGVNFMIFYLIWFINYCDSSKMVVTAMTVGSYVFGQWEKGNPFAALRIVLTKSVGTISVISLISAICEYIVYEATSWFWWTNPFDCLLRCLLEIFRSCIFAYTRFCGVVHAFSGLGFFKSGSTVLELMSRNFTGAYINDRIGVMVVSLGSNVFALGFAFAGWAWLEANEGNNVLAVVFELLGTNVLYLVLFFLLFVWFFKHPVLCLVVLVMFERPIANLFAIASSAIAGPFCALFIGSLASIVFRFQGDIILNAIDTLFVCSAVQDNNDAPQEAQDFYKLLHDEKGIILAQGV